MFDAILLGATGQQGYIVRKYLEQKGYNLLLSALEDDKFDKLSFETDMKGGTTIPLDLRDTLKLNKLISENKTKVVINCAEGDWNDKVYKACLDAGVNVIDLGSDMDMTYRQMDMMQEFADRGIIGITGCGSAPGIVNIMTAKLAEEFETIEGIECGFSWKPSMHRFVTPFSMLSILQEFDDSAVFYENGNKITKKPLSTGEYIGFKYIGCQINYLVSHPEIPMFELLYKPKDLHFWAGFPKQCVDIIKSLLELGFLSTESVKVGKEEILPIDFLNLMLQNRPYPLGYTEKEVLWTEISGIDTNGDYDQKQMQCVVPTIEGWTECGCNTDTGITAGIISEMIIANTISEPGSWEPGQIVDFDLFKKEAQKFQMEIFEKTND